MNDKELNRLWSIMDDLQNLNDRLFPFLTGQFELNEQASEVSDHLYKAQELLESIITEVEEELNKDNKPVRVLEDHNHEAEI